MTSLKTILKNFLNHVDKLESQKKLGQDPFEEEFQKLKDLTEQLKHDPNYSCSQGECDVNRRKNRYKDILPYNYTRVVLSEYPGVPGSDYINANYIKGGSGSLAYIASQGPLPNTMVDFWRMIWECEVQVVVMACKEQESGKYKCECYWPDEGEQRQYGNITVELVKWRQVCPDFLVRTLKACWEDETRTICQFHYATWPDHGVPTSVQPILELVRLVRDCQASEALPVLVHCSAGCGRTGTICAIDYVWGLMRMGKLTKSFSLYEIAAEMRRQRVAMVQTKEQYYLVHRAVTAMFEQQLRVIDSHTYENLDEDGEPLVWKELRDKSDTIYEDVYESTSTDDKEAEKRNHQEFEQDKNEFENGQQKSPAKYFSQELKNEEKEKSQKNLAVAGNSQRFWNQPENSMNTQQNLIEDRCQDSEDDSGQLSRRNSQILLKLKREESVKRLISGWNKVTEHSDTKSVSVKQSELKSKTITVQNNNIILHNKDNSVGLNQNSKHTNEVKDCLQQESSQKSMAKEKSASVSAPPLQETSNGTVNLNSEENFSTILDVDSYEGNSYRKAAGEERHLQGKLIGKATVIRRPSIAKLKALFEKSLNVESDSNVGLQTPQRRHPLFRSHSHHLSREFRPQQERETVLRMVARKLLRSPLRELQHSRQNDSKNSYSETPMSAAAEIECLTLLCSEEKSASQIQELSKAVKTLSFESSEDKLILEELCKKHSLRNVSENSFQNEITNKQTDSGHTEECLQVLNDKTESVPKSKETSKEIEKYSTSHKKLSRLNEKGNNLIENSFTSNYMTKSSVTKTNAVYTPNVPELPVKKKPLQQFGSPNHRGANWINNEKDDNFERTCTTHKNESVLKDKGELSLDGSGDYVVLRTRDPTIDVAFSRKRSQEEGIYGTIKHQSVNRDPKTEEYIPCYAKPVTVPISNMVQSDNVSAVRSNDMQKQYQVKDLQNKYSNSTHCTDIEKKCADFYDENNFGKINNKECVEQRNNIFTYDKSNQINKLSSSKIAHSVKATDIIHNPNNVQYTNINVTTKKNIAQIENILNHHPRGAILDLTSRKSYILSDSHAVGENNENTSSNAVCALKNSPEKACLPVNSKLKYEQLWSPQNNTSEMINKSDVENKQEAKSYNNNSLNETHLAHEWNKQMYGVQHYRLNQESGNSRNLLLHSPTPKSKRLHLPRTSNKPKNQHYNVYESPSLINNKGEKDIYHCKQISTEMGDLKLERHLNHNNAATYNVMSENSQKEEKIESVETTTPKECFNKQCQNKEYRIASENSRGIYQSPGGNLEKSAQNQTFDSSNHNNSFLNKTNNSNSNNVHSPKHHSYESIYGHLEQFVKRKQQKLDSDYEYVYPANNSKSRDPKYEDVIINTTDETSVKKPFSSPSHTNNKWMNVCENIPGSENWKLKKTHSPQNDKIQNYAMGPPKPPRTFSQMLPVQKENFQLSTNVKQPIASNDGGRLLVPVASPKSVSKQYYSQMQNNRNELKSSTCFHKDSQNIGVPNKSQSLSSWLQDSTYVTNDGTAVNKNSCAIYSLPSPSHEIQVNSNLHNRNQPNSPYHQKLKNVPIYATVREHFPVRYQPEKSQILKNANTYENIYDAQKIYYGINPAQAENYMGRSSQQIAMHGLRHSQSDASVYVALRSMRPMNNDSVDMRPQLPSYNEAVRPRRVGELNNVNRSKLDISYGMEQRRCRDDMDIRPSAVSRLKQEAHARRSMVEWDLGMTVAPDSQDTADMAEYSQVIRKPGVKKMNTRTEKMQKDDLPPTVPQKTRGAYEMPDANQAKEGREKSNRDGNGHSGFGGTISKAFGKFTLFTKFGSKNEQNNQPQVSGVVNKDGQGKKTNENTKVFSFPHRLPRKPRGSKHPPKQWTQV
ncbi:uncharacterized protein DDB_G0283357-like isoform X1 [Centruroides sculpturatus]|uniref:uncharacterized protein DDB_G0283357-like isoform X1 n=1 Tax=Centruroides sculpturatus TaxID=218467 RepID=UPI000C6D48B6|nr:uncharacterized protein DDB_G0283357-like isoform X1 [Centruroides sculpturatus]